VASPESAEGILGKAKDAHFARNPRSGKVTSSPSSSSSLVAEEEHGAMLLPQAQKDGFRWNLNTIVSVGGFIITLPAMSGGWIAYPNGIENKDQCLLIAEEDTSVRWEGSASIGSCSTN